MTSNVYIPEVSETSKITTTGVCASLGALFGGPAGFAVGAATGNGINVLRSENAFGEYTLQCEKCKYIFKPLSK